MTELNVIEDKISSDVAVTDDAYINDQLEKTAALDTVAIDAVEAISIDEQGNISG
jgi:hypothetical protein